MSCCLSRHVVCSCTCAMYDQETWFSTRQNLCLQRGLWTQQTQGCRIIQMLSRQHAKISIPEYERNEDAMMKTLEKVRVLLFLGFCVLAFLFFARPELDKAAPREQHVEAPEGGQRRQALDFDRMKWDRLLTFQDGHYQIGENETCVALSSSGNSLIKQQHTVCAHKFRAHLFAESNIGNPEEEVDLVTDQQAELEKDDSHLMEVRSVHHWWSQKSSLSAPCCQSCTATHDPHWAAT